MADVPPLPVLNDGNKAIRCEALGLSIEMGSFVIYEDDDYIHLGRLIDSRKRHGNVRVKVQLFPFFDKSSLRFRHSVIVGNTQHVREAIQTNRTSWIDNSQVTCVAFVLHLDELVESHACQGMSYLYQTRFCEDGSQVDQKTFKHFASEFDDFFGHCCTASRIWTDLLRGQSLLRSVLSIKKDATGEYHRQHRKMHMQPETWVYMKVLASTSIEAKQPVVSRARLMQHFAGPALETHTNSVEVHVEKFRWQSHQDLDTLVCFFGEACCFGLRRPRPRIRDPPAFLELYNTLNVISGCRDPCENPAGRTKQAGVDTLYCFKDRNFRMSVRFKKHLFVDTEQLPSKRLKRLVLRGDPHAPEEERDDDSDCSSESSSDSEERSLQTLGPVVELFDELIIDGEEVTVIAVELNGVTVEKSDGAATVITLQAARKGLQDNLD